MVRMDGGCIKVQDFDAEDQGSCGVVRFRQHKHFGYERGLGFDLIKVNTNFLSHDSTYC